MPRKVYTFDSVVRMVIALVIFIGIIYLINYLSAVLLPFVIASVVAYLIYPLVDFFQKKLFLRYRALSIIVVLLLLLGVAVGIVMFVVPPVVEESRHIKDLLVEYISNNTSSDTIPDFIKSFLMENVDVEKINKMFDGDNIMNSIKSLLPGVWNILSQSLNFLFGIFTFFIILMYLFFILLDYEKLEKGWIEVVPHRYRRFASHLSEDLQSGMKRYFRGQGLVALCVGILFSLGFLIIDFPMAVGLGLFIGFLNLVPYLQIVGCIPTVLLAALKAADTGENFWLILLAAFIVFAVVQTIQDFVLVPRIMGKIMGLNPAIILLSLSVWGALMGIIGMIIALPMTTLIFSYYKRFVINKEPIADELPDDNGDVSSK